jgi:hypothetical protein
MRGGHDGARPDIRGDGAIGKSLPYLTWVQSMARTLRRTTLRNWLCNLPACANLVRVAGLESVTPAAVYHLRGSDSDLSRAPLLLLSDLFGDLFRSFLHFLRTSLLLRGCYNSEYHQGKKY